LRNNAQYNFCAVLRDIWSWRQNQMIFEIMPALATDIYILPLFLLDLIFMLDKPSKPSYLTNLLP